MKLGNREKILAGAFGTFVLLFLIERFMLTPFLDRLDILDTETEAHEKKIGRLLSIDSQREEITKIFSDVKPYTEIGRTDEDALSVIMKKVEEVAKSSGIILVNMKPDMSSEKAEGGCKTRRLELSIEGSQKNIVKFVYQLENSKYPLSISKLDFKIKDRETNLMQADLDAYFIYFL